MEDEYAEVGVSAFSVGHPKHRMEPTIPTAASHRQLFAVVVGAADYPLSCISEMPKRVGEPMPRRSIYWVSMSCVGTFGLQTWNSKFRTRNLWSCR